jgi:hypothetical protein
VVEMTKQEQIEKYMKSLGISKEEAEQLWEDDQEDFIGEEGEEMTKKAKEIKRYEKAEKPKGERKPKERQIDFPKQFLLKLCLNGLGETVQNPTVKTETEINFSYGGEDYTLKLTRHRKKK